MTAKYLVDTDWAIHYFNGHTAITQRLQALQPAGLALSVVSLAELYEACSTRQRPTKTSAP